MKSQTSIIFNSRFLKKLSPLERYEFLQLCHRRRYREKEYIYHQGDPGTGMYILESGQVELIIEYENELGKKPSFTLEAPNSFGAFSMGFDIRRKSSARCITDCSLYGFFKPDFDTLHDRHPRIAIKFMEILNNSITIELELALDKLTKVIGMSEAYAIQFEAFKNE
ncbi:MAG: cyclic nucleotide-binding domain-containing protein [Balneolales bacterium]